MRALARRVGLSGLVGLLTIAASVGARPQDGPEDTVYRDDFEGPRVAWRQEDTDAAFLLRAHDRSEAAAHQGRLAEHFAFEAGVGSGVFYSYPLPKVPVVEGLRATLYVRSNRPGVQIFGVVVLPEDRDPDRGLPSEVFVPGSSLETADRWQRLELSGLPLAVERQARVKRLDSGREVSLAGAYLERIVVNLYGGAGASEVYLDELVVSPVPAESPPPEEVPPAAAPRESDGAPGGRARVELVGNRLSNGGADWFPFIVSAPGADLDLLRRASFDVLAVSPDEEPARLARAAELGFLLMPTLGRDGLVDPARAAAWAAAFPRRGDVAFWELGEGLGAAPGATQREDELGRVRALIQSVHELTEGGSRLTSGTVAGMFPEYGLFGNNLDLIGVEADGVGRMEDPNETFQYLAQRRSLTATANPNGLFWAWIPARSSQPIRSAVWGVDVPPAWGWPQVQPEQMRLYAYAAISAGYRGLGFRGDADLTRGGGLARLYEASLLVAELALVESILARGFDPYARWPAYPPDPKPRIQYDATGGNAQGMGGLGRVGTRTKQDLKEVRPLDTVKVSVVNTEDRRSMLLIVTDFAGGAQWQPPQMARRDVNLLVPAPDSAQAFEITLGGVHKLESRRDAGGRRVVLPTFNTTALVLLTTDLSVKDRVEQAVAALSPRAADIAIKQAELQLGEVDAIHAMLVEKGSIVRSADNLLAEARELIQSAREALDRQNFALAWSEARTVGQPLRILMRAHWDRAFRDLVRATAAANKLDGLTPVYDAQGRPKRPPQLVGPVACPPLLAWQTLPQYYYWRDWLRGEFGPFGGNRLATGTFDADPEALRQAGWVNESYATPDLLAGIAIDRKEGWGPRKTSLKLRVEPAAQLDRERFRKPDGKFDKESEEAYTKALAESIDALPPYLDHPIAAVRSPAVAVRATNFVRIRVLVKMPRDLVPGRGGLIVRDSLGGEALQFRATGAIPEWKEVVLYRRAPADGEVSVLLGLAGYGEAYFDQLRVDVLGDSSSLPEESGGPSMAPVPIARRPQLPGPAPSPPSPGPRR